MIVINGIKTDIFTPMIILNGIRQGSPPVPILTFNGTDNYINLGNPAYLNFVPRTDTFEIEFGIDNFTAPGTDYLYDKRGAGDLSTNLRIFFSTSVFYVYGGETETQYAITIIKDGNYHTVKIEIPASSTGLKVYFDGVAQTPTSGTGAIGTSNNTTDDVIIGGAYNFGNLLPASISNLKITKNGTVVFIAPFDEGVGTTVSDRINSVIYTVEGTTTNIWDNTT